MRLEIRNHDRACIHAQHQLSYSIRGQKKRIAVNRKPPYRAEKCTKPSLSEWYEKQVKLYGEQEADRLRSQLRVKPSKRIYNRVEKILPGRVVYHDKKRYVMRANKNNGYYTLLVGYHEEDLKFKSEDCVISKRKSSLVYVNTFNLPPQKIGGSVSSSS